MKSKFKQFFKKIIEVLKKPEMAILPGQLAFFFVLSLIPLIALLGGITSLMNISNKSTFDFLNNYIPKSVVDLFKPMLTAGNIKISTLVFFISSFILASNGPHSIILTSNMVYNKENDKYIIRRIKALLMTIILVMLLLFIIIIPVFGDKIIGIIISIINKSSINYIIINLYSFFKYPLSFIFIFANIKLLYTLAPDFNIRSKYTTFGSLFTTILWIIATEVYSLYIDVFAKYDLFYGSISNILILMLWIYILSYIFTMGIALNASIYKMDE